MFYESEIKDQFNHIKHRLIIQTQEWKISGHHTWKSVGIMETLLNWIDF